jgi:hypothetical protein
MIGLHVVIFLLAAECVDECLWKAGYVGVLNEQYLVFCDGCNKRCHGPVCKVHARN